MAILQETHKIYTDHMGKFPMTSSQGNKYVLIMFVYDANGFLVEPLDSRSGSHIMEA